MKNPKKHIGNENLKNKLLAPKLEVPTYILNQEGLKNGFRLFLTTYPPLLTFSMV